MAPASIWWFHNTAVNSVLSRRVSIGDKHGGGFVVDCRTVLVCGWAAGCPAFVVRMTPPALCVVLRRLCVCGMPFAPARQARCLAGTGPPYIVQASVSVGYGHSVVHLRWNGCAARGTLWTPAPRYLAFSADADRATLPQPFSSLPFSIQLLFFARGIRSVQTALLADDVAILHLCPAWAVLEFHWHGSLSRLCLCTIS